MSAEGTYPVQVLREHTSALEAALSVCLADPDHKPVHKLRTETRRIEAQLLLLAQLPEVPEHRDEATALLKELKKLRRAAGEVRDLDVQRKLLEEYTEPQRVEVAEATANGAAAKGKGAKKGSKKRASDAQGDGAGDGASGAEQQALRKGASQLRTHMGKQRDEAESDLLKLLKKRQTRAAAAGEELLKRVDHADGLALGVDDLLHHARGLLERDGLLERGDMSALSEDELHAVRKAAKAARYLAETLPDNGVAEGAAQRFEALQEAGGQWHDLLDLTRASRRMLGKSHELTVALAKERDGKLEEYREALRGEVRRDARPREEAPGSKRGQKSAKQAARAGARSAANSAKRPKVRA